MGESLLSANRICRRSSSETLSDWELNESDRSDYAGSSGADLGLVGQSEDCGCSEDKEKEVVPEDQMKLGV